MPYAVELEGVRKSFGQFVAVDDLDLRIPLGSVYGFIGPNGSGKTTTLRMIMRIYLPDRGKVCVLGDSSWQAASDRVGYLPEERSLYKQMKVRDVLRFFAELKGCRDSKKPIETWLERMNLAAWGDKKVDALSKGMAQKVQFIATVVARPELVILDEPFSGLDPVNMEVFREAILSLRRDGATIIFSTHDMAVAEKMCDAIFMIYKGRKVLDGTMESIHERYDADTVRVKLEGKPSLEGLDGVLQVVDFGQYQELRLDPTTDSQRLLSSLMARGPVQLFEKTKPSLHTIFVRIAAPTEESGHA